MATLSDTHQWDLGAPVESPGAPANWCFEDFVRNNCERLVQTLSLVALDRETAADAAQEAFLELYLHLDEVRDPVPWLYKVALNRCLDYRRRVARGVSLFERLVGVSSPQDWIAPAMASSEFRDSLARLPGRQRTAATLFYLADLSISEIATVMNVSDGSVNRHLYRAREALRKTLEVP